MSGTYAYVPSLDDLLTDAWERCGKSPTVLNGDVVRSARRSLQLMMIDWTNRGANLWQIEPRVLTLATGQASIALTPELVDVMQATVSVGGNDLVITPISRDEYVSIPNKSLTSRPTQYWVQRVLPAPIMWLYPTPDQPYQLTAQCLRQPQDVMTFSAGADAPLLFAEAVTAGLAARLSMKFAMDRYQLLSGEAAIAYRNATGEDRERVPLRVTPRVSR